ncbi:MAG: transcriptional regulator, partial [Gammaproteobacteria bacterium]|nr:transcriptional regulator [Gammaproteobacteria bacterium]
MRKQANNFAQIIIVGLAIAFVVQLFYPELFSHKKVVEFIDAGNETFLGLRSSGPVSYADAVDKAAPAVVNIFTKKRVHQTVP